jgi:hypothetical protein
VKIVQSPSIGLDDQGNFFLSIYMIIALCLLLVADPKTNQITWPETASFTVEGITIKFSDIQGDPRKLVDIFRSISEKQSNESLHRIADKPGSR